jgi:hypothetical protein
LAAIEAISDGLAALGPSTCRSGNSRPTSATRAP